MKTVKDVEMQVEEKVSGALQEVGLLPQGYRCSVRLRGKERDKKRNASFEKSWSPDTDSVTIRFDQISAAVAPAQPVTQGAKTVAQTSDPKPRAAAEDRLSDLIRALDHAESRPGYGFVALKWFRDSALPSEGLSWTGVDSARHDILREAIDKRFILLNKVQNPKSPQFPVTAIRLNRLMPEVKSILGNPEPVLSEFQPVPIRGDHLSATVLRDRR